MTEPDLPHYLALIQSTSNKNLVSDVPDMYNTSISSNDTIPIIRETSIQILFSLIYATIFVLGVFGNVLVCYVVFHNKNMHTVTNFFITNLALSDILLCILAVPFTPTYTFLGTWIFGPVLCHLVPYAQMVSVFVSTLTLTAIAIDRYFVIMYPFQPRMRLGTSLPYAYCMTLAKHSDSATLCNEDWSSETFQRIYGTIMAFSQFIIPFFIIAFCYIKVSLKLNDRAKLKPGSKNLRREEWDRERKKRTNRMLIAMVFIFGFCWSPINVINLVNDLHEDVAGWFYYYVVFFITHSIAMSSTCYNPFLYAWLNDNFRKEFKQVLPFFSSAGGASSRSASKRLSNWRSDRACNGAETCAETLLATSVVLPGKIDDDEAAELQTEKVKEDILLVAYSSVTDKVEVHPEFNRSHSGISNGHHESRVDVL
ncbi:hypothetical protein M8J75_016382 [Diaphorina citri]|nr:hypothetical protein M8J75_016382 [Diaphorina citri]